MSLRGTDLNPKAWYVDRPRMEPVINENFLGDVTQGGFVNFTNVYFNPHGHGTHTECVGHISDKKECICEVLQGNFFITQLITITPQEYEGEETIYSKGDLYISLEQIAEALGESQPEALVIRTTPNSDEKLTRQYSGTNPPYLHWKAAELIYQKGIKHLLVDVPSLDPESDDGRLLAHRAFWNYPQSTAFANTITELIYAPDTIADGKYLMNLQTANFKLDATPSRPVLYPPK